VFRDRDHATTCDRDGQARFVRLGGVDGRSDSNGQLSAAPMGGEGCTTSQPKPKRRPRAESPDERRTRWFPTETLGTIHELGDQLISAMDAGVVRY
jgi:hypothetical protein